MDNLYLDYEQGLSLGSKIQSEAKDLKSLLSRIKEIQDKLEKSLDEENDKNYLSSIVGQTKIMEKLSETIEETGNFLVNVSTAYEEAANSNLGD